MNWWVTPSGTTVNVEGGREYTRPSDAGVHYDITVRTSGGQSRLVSVRLDEPQYVNTLLLGNGLPPLDERRRARAAWIAAIRAVDETSGFFEVDEPLTVDLDYDVLAATDTPSKLDDRALRRYIARRLYLHWQSGAFESYLGFDDRDTALTGAGPTDFLRNCQLLSQEGFLQLDGTHDPGFDGFSVRGLAPLIRDVERHGAAAGDIESQEDYEARVRALRTLSACAEDVLAERRRYQVARTPGEVASVFRAVVPLLEGAIRLLLRESGSRRDHPSLGPMIQELTDRRIGSLGFRTQVSAVHTNARDISLHGEELPVAVLRIAAEMCFELFPQVGQLFPSSA